MRDPEHSNMVIAAMPTYAAQLSVSDYGRIDSDMGALCQFYDFVKTKNWRKQKAHPQKFQRRALESSQAGAMLLKQKANRMLHGSSQGMTSRNN